MMNSQPEPIGDQWDPSQGTGSWPVSLQDTLPSFGEFGEVPFDWELANVPVPERGRKEDSGHYGPVGLTSAPIEITEEVVWELLKNT